MRVLHAFQCPVLECLDASLTVQSEKASTLIPEILKRFTATGVMPNAHSPAEAKDPTEFPESFVEGMNNLTERRSNYDDQGVNVLDGIKRDFDDVVSSVSSVVQKGDESSGKTGADGDSVSGSETGEKG